MATFLGTETYAIDGKNRVVVPAGMRHVGERKAPLTQFVLPGGSPLAAALHHARTVCRRAERRVTALAAREPVSPHVVHWLNRLADLLFVMARWCNRRAGVAETTWSRGTR